MAKVILILGAGAGIGTAIGEKFANNGFHACLARRSDEDGLKRSVDKITTNGGNASGFIVDATASDQIEDLIDNIESKIGEIHTAVYNVGAQIGNRKLEDTSLKTFELGWKLGTFGLFRMAKTLLPKMVSRGSGNLLVTGATASLRGNGGQLSHASTMGARRLLCQSLNAEFGRQGIHIAHIVIDGMVNAPDTLGKMLGEEAFEELKQQRGYGKNGILEPSAIADTYYHLAHQHPSAWTHETELRPQTVLPWWNDMVIKELDK